MDITITPSHSETGRTRVIQSLLRHLLTHSDETATIKYGAYGLQELTVSYEGAGFCATDHENEITLSVRSDDTMIDLLLALTGRQ